MIKAVTRLPRDPELLAEFERIVKQPAVRRAFKAAWDLAPRTSTDLELHPDVQDTSLHTYWSKLVHAGWLCAHGKHKNESNSSSSTLYEISGVVGRPCSDYIIRTEKKRNGKITTATSLGKGQAVRIGRNVAQDVIDAYKCHYAKKFIGIDDLTVQSFFRKLEIEFDILREVLDMESARVLRQGAESPTRAKLKQACKVLKIPFPGDVATARKKMRELSRLYHPDSGNPAGVDQFRLVISAFETIEAFAEAAAK